MYSRVIIILEKFYVRHGIKSQRNKEAIAPAWYETPLLEIYRAEQHIARKLEIGGVLVAKCRHQYSLQAAKYRRRSVKWRCVSAVYYQAARRPERKKLFVIQKLSMKISRNGPLGPTETNHRPLSVIFARGEAKLPRCDEALGRGWRLAASRHSAAA